MNFRKSVVFIVASFGLVFSWLNPAQAGSFIGAAGNYGGVIDPGIGGDPGNSGLVQIQLKESGTFSGALIWQSQRYALKGRLEGDGSFSKVFTKKGAESGGQLTLSFTLSAATLSIAGELKDEPTGSSPVVIQFNLTGAPPDSALAIQLQPGTRISFIDPPDPSNEDETETAATAPLPGPAPAPIPGDGFSVVTLGKTASRAARLVGRLPDYDGAYSAGSPLRGGDYSVFSSLYKKKKAVGGQLFGKATVQNNGDPTPQFQSQLRWGKRQNFDPDFYSGGIDRGVFLDAVPYPKVKRGALVPILPGGSEPTRSINARMTFRRGNIRLSNTTGGTDRFFRVNLAIAPFSSKVAGSNPYQVKIKVDAFSGRFRGTFMHPVLNVKTKFEGAFQSSLLLVPGIGRGNFRPFVKDSTVTLNEPLESGGVTVSVN
jgi:hypothetical protein